jgi:predicted anti-sigma-YlaC factor YlaD
MTYNPTLETSGACPEFEARLYDRISGELSPADAAALDAHLKTCAACSAALVDASFSARLLRVAEPAADPGPSFAHLTMARIRQETDRAEEKSIWSPFVSLAWKFAATSGVALALLLTFDISRHREPVDGTYISPSDDSGLFSDGNYSSQDRDDFLITTTEGSHGKR